MGRRLFVADEDVLDPAMFEQRVVDRQHRAARIAEHDLHAEVDQGLDQYGGSTLLWHGVTPQYLAGAIAPLERRR